MKAVLIIALALVASASAYDVDDIPEFMRERLDKYVQLQETWKQKWLSMNQEERETFERVIYDRLSHIPDSVKLRIHSRIASMDEGDRIKLRDYLYQRFPELKVLVTSQENDVDEIDAIIENLPQVLREKISDFIAIRFAPATAYENVDDADFIDFPEIPELIEIPTQGDGTPYSEDNVEEEVRTQVDAFLLKREDWRRRWENLPEEKREAFEKYIKAKMNKAEEKDEE
ncbi:uncharacterized protein [Chironomus tepperi]|uniref:uncharacterized protein n=1 Tax=Chironomus tepperi TaxID=113505 RepID=UPI00391F00A7